VAACLVAPFLSSVGEGGPPVERHHWVAGVAYGVGPANVDLNSTEMETDWRRGASPQFRLGRMIGRHFMIGLEDRQWMDEGGIRDYKIRGNIQNVSLVMTTYPGRTTDWTSGFLVQLGAGIAHARISALKPIEGGQDEWGATYELVDKRDESGWGFVVGGGYEFRVSSHFAVGVVATFNYLEFHDQIIDQARFIPGGLNLNWYF
jgi:opacity protein-like surface antigen